MAPARISHFRCFPGHSGSGGEAAPRHELSPGRTISFGNKQAVLPLVPHSGSPIAQSQFVQCSGPQGHHAVMSRAKETTGVCLWVTPSPETCAEGAADPTTTLHQAHTASPIPTNLLMK